MKPLVMLFFVFLNTFVFGQDQSNIPQKDTIPNTTTLEEVVLIDKKKTISYNNGTTTATIENTPLASLATPVAILSKLPGAHVSPDQESLTVIGKGSPIIYLNNQRISMLELQALAVDTIKSITIIPNPSVKYEAEGRAVLLITLKQVLSDRFRIALSEIAASKRRLNNYLSLHTDFKKQKFEFKSNFAFNQLHHWERNGSIFDLPSQNFKQEYLVSAIGPRPQFIIGGGLYYGITETTYISMATNLKTQRTDIPIRTSTEQQIGADIKVIETFSDQQEHRDIFRSTINFNSAFKNGNIFIGGQYAYYLRNLDSRIANQFDLAGFRTSQIRNQDNRIDSFVTRFDLEFNCNNKMKLELGSNVTFARSKAFSNFQFLDTTSSEFFNYSYVEDNYASYVQVSKEAKKLRYAVGTRFEKTFVKAGFQNENQLLINRKKMRVFPKAELEIPLDSTNSITLNYAKSIQRPRYRDAIALNIFINPFLDWTTNLNLLPTVNHEVSTSLQYKKQNIKLSYSYKEDPAYVSVNFNEDRLVMSTQNLEQETEWQLQFQNSYKYQFWSISSTLSFLWNNVIDRNALLETAKPYLYYALNNEFQLGQKTTLAVDFWGLTKSQIGAFEYNAITVLGASLTKNFSEQLTLSINTNDIFRAMNFEHRYTIFNINSVTTYFADAQELSFSVKYTLGDIKKSKYQNKEVNDTLDRIQ